ncbi:7626_t:CDS:2, partial [Acaulospora colombiana]
MSIYDLQRKQGSTRDANHLDPSTLANFISIGIMAAQPQPARYDIAAKLKEMDTVPLFMKSLPNDPNENSDALEALQALYISFLLTSRSTKEEIASNFKEQGNDCFKQKRYRDALGFYNQALEAKPTDTALNESLLLNRAACNLELKNYGSVLRDTSKVLTTNANNLKAFYRAASALIALERAVEAIDCCKRALQIDPENSGIKSVLEKAEKLKALQDKKEEDKRRAKEEAATKQQKLDEALK